MLEGNLSSLYAVFFLQFSSMQLTISLCLILWALCFMAYLVKSLTITGAIAAYFTALVLAFGDLSNLILPLILLLGGTFLTKLNKQASDKMGRNAKQVFANGGIGLLCLMLYYLSGNALYYLAFLISFSVSISDTFSSEIGQYFKSTTFDIYSMNPIPSGLSGGISWIGTLGGLMGAIICTILSFLFLKIQLSDAFLVGALGYAGMLLDSLLGSRLQAKYLDENNVLNEIKLGQLVKGYKWCTNDVVNLMANAITVLVFILIRSL